MRKEDFGELKQKDLEHVVQPLKRDRFLKSVVDIGFDTEFTTEDFSSERELLSVQFSLGVGKSVCYAVNKREGITSHELLDYALRFMKENGVEKPKQIFLISHFATAELSKISDFYDEYEKIENGHAVKVRPRVAEFNKAISWSRRFDDEDVTLHIMDLFGHFKMSLEAVGEGVGVKKLSIEADGLGHSYWITHMKELQVKHLELYVAYAIRDAEVAIVMWQQLVERYTQLHIDPHFYGTYSSITVAAFRRNSMKKLPCATREEKTLSRQKMKDGSWREHIAKHLAFKGDLNARRLACLCYWGGNNQSFARGYFKNVEITQWDFKSLYIIAGILQPLSNEETVYKPITLEDVRNGAEGFCEVEFSFPDGTRYPTLPIKEDWYQKLMFVLRGRSYCTAAEVRGALELGAEIRMLNGYGFMPTENEVNSDLRQFLIDMLAKKDQLEKSGRKESADYAIEKAKMVGFIGRFAYMKSGSNAEDIMRLLHFSGLKSEEFKAYGRKKAIRAMYTRSEVGGSWSIEWASLILGRARALVGWAINEGTCLAISTDGGFWLGNPHLDESIVSRKLESLHSGIRREDLKKPIDEFWICRRMCYIAWSKGEAVHVAMGGVAVEGSAGKEKKADFERIVRENLAAKTQVRLESNTSRLSGLVADYIHEGTPLNSTLFKVKKVRWLYDGKRVLDRDVNLWAENTMTKPYESVEEAYHAEFPAKKPSGGRPRGIMKLTQKEIDEIRAADKKVTHAELAKEYNVSVSTVRRLRE